jgi:hypothetical protein
MNTAFKHHQSAHCENGVTSNLLRHHHITLSEPMVFGIGSGLFFSYMPFLKLNGIPVTSFRPMPGMIFKRATKRLGIKVHTEKFRKEARAMQALDNNLNKNIPTGCVVGVFHLTYFPASYRFHFNAHNLVVFDKKDDTYLISDPVMEGTNELTFKDLQRVRFAKGLAAPQGKMYHIIKTPEKIDLRNAIIKGIKKTCQEMLHIPIPFFGVRGITFLSGRMRKWPQKLGDKKAALYIGQVIRMLEEIGTGGAGFRFMYAAFLQEASEVLQQPQLMELSKEMTEIGDLWRKFSLIASRICKDRAAAGISYDTVADLLHEIGIREKALFLRLEKIKY